MTIHACEPITNAAEIDCVELNRLLLSGGPGFVLQLAEDTPLRCKPTKLVEPVNETLLQEFPEVFQEPAGLPPKRECDHKIPLKPNSAPPNYKPYKVPRMQKNELERQIDQLLQSKIIRESQSPCSSPVILVMKKDGT